MNRGRVDLRAGRQDDHREGPEQCRRANEAGRQPVAFAHGLWLLPQQLAPTR